MNKEQIKVEQTKNKSEIHWQNNRIIELSLSFR